MSDSNRILALEFDRDNILDDVFSTPNLIPTSPLITPLPSTKTGDLSSQSKSPSENTMNVLDLKMQDFDHQRRFVRFLAKSGIKRRELKKSKEVNSSGYSRVTDIFSATESSGDQESSINGDSTRYNLFPDSSDISDQEQDSSLIDITEEGLPSEVQKPLLMDDTDIDQDLFYHDNSAAFPASEEKLDQDQSLEDSKVFDDSENHTIYFSDSYYESLGNSDSYEKRSFSFESSKCSIPLNSNDTFFNFENGDKDLSINLIPDFQIPEGFEAAVKFQPAGKFKDSLRLKLQGYDKISLGTAQKYKNNVCCCSARHDITITGTNSELTVFKRRKNDYLLDKEPYFKFDIRPGVTTAQHRESSTWPYYPHTINYIKIGEFLEAETLIVACDDGRVLVYILDDLMTQIDRLRMTAWSGPNNTRFYGLNINPDFKLVSSASVWGVDMYKNMIIVSDNSQSMKLFYFDFYSREEYSVQTHQMLHNVPSVSFIKGENDDEDIYVSAVSISGEVVIFKFPLDKYEGPLNENQNGESSDFKRVIFKVPYVISRISTRDSAWTTEYVDASSFMKVSSLEHLTGDPWIDQYNVKLNRILYESKILDVESDFCHSSHLGLAANFHCFAIPTVSLSQQQSIRSSANLFTSLSDNYRRIRKIYDDYYFTKQRNKEKSHTSIEGKQYWEPIAKTPQFEGKFLLVSTGAKVALLRANKLICNANVSDLFQYKSTNENLMYSNRLSLRLLIPELNCYIVGSQVGLVSVFRLTTFRGLYSMRQEYIIPNYNLIYLSGDFGIRTLIGLSCMDLGDGRWILYLTYIDGLCLAYELRRPHGEGVSGIIADPVFI